MLRKTILGLTAVLALGAAAIAPTAASAGGINIGVGFGGGYGHHGYHGGYYGGYGPVYYEDYGPVCKIKKIKVWNPGPGPDWVWKKKKVCY